jgi:uncharacterized protein
MRQLFSKCLLGLLCVAGVLGQSALVMSVPFLSAEAVAQTTAGNSEPASRQDVENLFAMLKLDRMMQVTMTSAAEQMKNNLPELMKQQNIQIPQEQLDAMAEDIFRDYPMKEVLDSMIPVYQKHLTKADVGNILAFYQSPTGQKMLNEMPEMSKEAMQAANPVMKQWMVTMMQRMQDRAHAMADQNSSQKQGTNSKAK